MNNNSSVFRSQSGQLLIEVLVAMAVGGGLLIAASAAIVSVIRQNYESRGAQTAASYAYDLISRVREYAGADWHNIYNLAHGSTNKYFVVSSATSSVAIGGQESVLSNDIAAGLVGHWKFDETGGLTAYDSSGSGNSGSLTNNPTRQSGTNCRVESCLNFNSDNSQYVSVVPSGSLSGSFTVMGWGKPNTTATLALIGTRAPSDASFDMKFQNGNTIHGDIGNGTGWITTSADASFNYSTGTWYHVAYVVTPTNYIVYVNGNNVGSGTYATSTPLLYDSSHYIYVGRYGGGGEDFNGNIDDVRIYNRVLSANEISQLYTSTVYSRYFYVNSVNRTQCGIGNITSDSTTGCTNIVGAGASDIANDPSTQKVTAVVTRADGASYPFYEYATRNRNSVFTQNDWSGGSGQEGPITIINDKYSSSTNITAGTTLALTSNDSDGILYSSTFDTQASSGATYNEIIWNGTATNGSSVKFQIASSNSPSSSGGGPTGLIDSLYRYAWNDYIGWVDFGYVAGEVAVQDTQLVGYAYNDDVGEISLDCTTTPVGDICYQSDYKVFRDSGTGNLSGWAWNDEIGWISFRGTSPAYGVNVNTTTGMFTGYAWNDIVGWISFNCADPGLCDDSDYKVATAGASGWRYIGPDGSIFTDYIPVVDSDNNWTATVNPAYHTDHRYFRYKVTLSPDSGHTTSPSVTGINIGWSP